MLAAHEPEGNRHRVVVGERIHVAAHEVSLEAAPGGVHLAAALPLQRGLDRLAEAPQQPHRRASRVGEQRIDQAGRNSATLIGLPRTPPRPG